MSQLLSDPNSKAKDLPPSDFTSGQVVAERYRIDSVLGRGGMGVVYKVEQIYLKRLYAMKTLDVQNASEMAWRRFQKEAETVSRLDHANIICIHDFGLIDERQPFYVMDLVSGESLQERIKRTGPLSLDETLKCFIKIAFALAHAHANGVVHRDIKPSNIMFGRGESAHDSLKIVDFGISKLVSEGAEQQNLTRTGEIFGSPLYMSPEQCLGTAIDHRTDIYSFGCTMFDALTGCPPHVGDTTLSTMMKHREELQPSLKEASLGSNFSESIEALMAKLLEKNPESRYQSFNQVAEDLIAIEAGRPLHRQKPPTITAAIEKNSNQANKRLVPLRRAGGVLSSVILVILLASLAYVYRQSDSKVDRVEVDKTSETQAVSSKPAHTWIADPRVEWFYKTGVLSRATEADRSRLLSIPFSSICVDQNGEKVRVFQFPQDFSVGSFVVQKQQIAGQGDVVIPGLDPVEFHASYQCCERPSILSKFRDDEISILDLKNVETASDDTLSYVQGWKELYRVNLGFASVTDRGLKHLENCRKLTELNLSTTEITGMGMARFKRLGLLTKLTIDVLPHGEKVIAALKNSKNIVWLSACQLHLKDQDLEKIATMRNLEALDIGSNTELTDKGLEALSNMPKLKCLMAPGCHFTPNCIETLKKFPALRELEMAEGQYSFQQQQQFEQGLPHVRLTYKAQAQVQF